MSEENEQARSEALARMRKKQEAYRAVFGPADNRTPLGAVILEDLERFARYHDRSIYRDLQGRFDGGSTAYNMGMHDLVKRIHLMITRSEHGLSD